MAASLIINRDVIHNVDQIADDLNWKPQEVQLIKGQLSGRGFVLFDQQWVSSNDLLNAMFTLREVAQT